MNDQLRARIEESDRLQRGQEAEGQGLRAANIFDKPYQFSKDPYRQARFELGHRDGKAILEVDHAIARGDTGSEVTDGGLSCGESDDAHVRIATEAQPSPYSG